MTAPTKEPRVYVARGTDGWKLTCVVDEWQAEGVALVQRILRSGAAADGVAITVASELLIGTWRLGSADDGPTVLTVEIDASATLPVEFLRTIRDALADAATKQLGAWGVDAFELS